MPAHMAMYATAKAAVIAFMEAIRAEMAQDGIGVSVLCPGPIKSNIHQLKQNRPEQFGASEAFEAAADKLSERQVSDLWMEPEQVGDMVVKAIRGDEFYIITHGEWANSVTARYEAIMAAMPTETNPELMASMRRPKPAGAA